MLKRYAMSINPIGGVVIAIPTNFDGPVIGDAVGVRWVRYSDVEPLLKRLAGLEAKEQKREQFERECG